jgi:hypothetical protein
MKEFGSVHVFEEIALVAAGVISRVEPGKIGNGLLDSTVGLCERMRFARLKSGASRWWSDQMAKATNKTDFGFILRVLLTWATPRTIVQLATELTPLVDELDSPAFSRLLYFLGRTRREKITLEDSDYAVLKKSSPRLAAILVERATRSRADQIIFLALQKYRGSDAAILRTCIENMIHLVRQDHSKWKVALPLIKHAYENDVVFEVTHRHAGLQSADIDVEFASEVLRDPAKYPLALVASAQGHFTELAGRSAKPLGAVARSEQWFAA